MLFCVPLLLATLLVAEASCRSAIRTARNIVKDIGPEQARNVGGLVSLAGCSESHSERDTHNLLTGKLGLSLPLSLHTLPGEGPSDADNNSYDLLMIRLRDWAAYLLESNSWHILSGLKKPNPERERAIWTSWWDRYKSFDPTHEVFSLASSGKIDLSCCAAILLHGDEGRGRRRQAFMVLSYLSVLGRGSGPNVRKGRRTGAQRHFNKQKLNFLGHTYCSRFVTGVLPRSLMNDYDAAFDKLLQAVYEEANFMSRVGVQDRLGRTHYMILLRTVGDWPFLAKAGRLKRSFSNVMRRVGNVSNGVCHLCQAGEPSWPFEDIGTRRPGWASTRNCCNPFRELPLASIVPHTPGRLPSHFAFDLFHCVHLGVGKNLASAMIAVLSNLEEGNIEERLMAVTKKYRSWCREHGRAMVISKITKDTLSWQTRAQYPTGGWFKADLTTNFLEWIESLDGTLDVAAEPVLIPGMEAVKTLNRFVRMLYELDAWLSPQQAVLAGQIAFQFLRRYQASAFAALQRKEALFILQPKLHVVQHMALELLEQGSQGLMAMNPLIFSNQMNEDVIGKASRLSRRVSARTVIQRVLERYLQACYEKWVAAGYLIAPKPEL